MEIKMAKVIRRGQDDHEFKIHISRVPTTFTEEIVERILEDKLGQLMRSDDHNSQKVVKMVELIYPRDEDEENDDPVTDEARGTGNIGVDNGKVSSKLDDYKKHRGFGFVSFSTQEALDLALKLQTIKGGRKLTSKRLHTMHLRPYQDKSELIVDGGEGGCGERDVCYLWSLNRCPYGEDCKFLHEGPGGSQATVQEEFSQNERQCKKKGKCFAYKKGKCNKGDDCPFSHDFKPTNTKVPVEGNKESTIKMKSEKDCINWKTKGKCRKGDNCEYRHGPKLLQKHTAAKEQNKKRARKDEDDSKISKHAKREKQPLAVRIFGLPYDCTEENLREFFKDCGIINRMLFPTFEDSGRSKGYCGIWFASPKAVAKALELDGMQFQGRWLRIQSGKSMTLKEWESLHQDRRQRE
jgi:RNA recognition motif-containing protein